MPCAGIDGNPFHDITRLAFEGDIPSDATISRGYKGQLSKLRVNRQPGGKADWFVAGLCQPKNSP